MDEQPETAIGSASDETQVVAKDAETQLGGWRGLRMTAPNLCATRGSRRGGEPRCWCR
jgi:hypothetical protein